MLLLGQLRTGVLPGAQSVASENQMRRVAWLAMLAVSLPSAAWANISSAGGPMSSSLMLLGSPAQRENIIGGSISITSGSYPFLGMINADGDWKETNTKGGGSFGFVLTATGTLNEVPMIIS